MISVAVDAALRVAGGAALSAIALDIVRRKQVRIELLPFLFAGLFWGLGGFWRWALGLALMMFAAIALFRDDKCDCHYLHDFLGLFVAGVVVALFIEELWVIIPLFASIVGVKVLVFYLARNRAPR